MKVYFQDNSGNEKCYQADSYVECLEAYISDMDTVVERIEDDDGNELGDDLMPI